ncbi:MAG: WD40/YVTN/BNR-like repeat-containing protein [Terriglobales bacterium]
MSGRLLRFGFVVFLGLAVSALAQVNPNLYAGLRWRDIGPHHGGRIASVTGAIGHGQAGVFYAGLPQGGIEKTTDAGVTWFPDFDMFKNVDSVGAIEVAPSNPNIVYAGTGDSIDIGGSNGDGMYKSTDAGKTWTHVGLENTVKIDAILISPTDPNVVLASTQGDHEHNGRGIFRSTDGGQTWTNVFNPEGYNGTREMARAFDDPSVVFATVMGSGGGFGPPQPNVHVQPAELFKSTDGGQTWTQVTSFPSGYTSRVTVAVAMGTDGQRVYVYGNSIDGGSGLFRSDDGGQTWQHMDPHDRAIEAGSYTQGVYVDSTDNNIVYTMSTAVWRSTDGGNTFTPFKGAPGGEDAHPMWIDPTNGNRMIEGMDQGAGVTLNGGQTWSSYYAQTDGQIYHIITTNQYPFWVMGSQQDTNAVMVRNRSDYGQINHDWQPFPSSEFGRLAASPIHPNIVYGVGYGPGGGGSGLVRINMTTGDWENVAPNFGANAARYHQFTDFAKHFDTAFDPNAFYVAYQCLMETTDGAASWRIASPDLTTTKGQPQIECGASEPKADLSATPSRRGPPGNYIADFSISTAKQGVIWTVSNNGQIYNTTDGGKHWTNVSNIPGVSGTPDNGHVVFLNIQASHQDPQTAYIAGRLGGARDQGYIAGVDTNVPLIWRTSDGGQSWTKIVSGLPTDQRTGSWVNVVREDPQQPGLLFCGTESAAYVSFDNGSNWQSLQLNMPTTSIRDLKIHTFDHEDDLVVATYGRGIWVLDDASPLRTIAKDASAIAAAPAYLFPPNDAIRSRENVSWDQPTEPWEHYAPNPPYGAILYYHLNQAPTGPITLRVYDAAGNLVWTRSSTPPPPITDAHYPAYWLATPASRSLSTAVGTNRTNWNLRYTSPPAFREDLENQMNSVEHETTAGPKGPQAIPGVYTLKLAVDGQTYTRKLTVINDPRVGQGPEVMAALRAQNRMNMLAYHAMETTYAGHAAVAKAQAQLTSLEQGGSLQGDVASRAKSIEAQLTAIGGKVQTGGFFFRGAPAPKPGQLESFVDENNAFNAMVSVLQVGLDIAPPPAQIATWKSDCEHYNQTVTAWNQMQTKTLVAFNNLLQQNHLQPITVSASQLADPSCSF